jgi:two-component system, LuxR family, response regulator FixJ
MSAQQPTIYIVDDDEQVRDSIQLLMESVGLSVESYGSAQEYLQHFRADQRGCLVLDVRMRGMSGLELQAHLQQVSNHPPIVMISAHGDVPMAVRALQAGAIDFLEKPFNDQALLDSVHRAMQQDALRRGEATRIAEIKERIARLTPREAEVMRRVVDGQRNKVIALEMNITQSTVEAHRSRVMEKMAAKTLSELMRMLVTLEICEGMGQGAWGSNLPGAEL